MKKNGRKNAISGRPRLASKIIKQKLKKRRERQGRCEGVNNCNGGLKGIRNNARSRAYRCRTVEPPPDRVDMALEGEAPAPTDVLDGEGCNKTTNQFS